MGTHADQKLRTWILGIAAAILVNWMGWISKAVIDLDRKVGIIDDRLQIVATVTPHTPKPVIESGLNFFEFLQKEKK